MGRLLRTLLALLESTGGNRAMEFLWLMKPLGWTVGSEKIPETGPLCLKRILVLTPSEQSSDVSLLQQPLGLDPRATERLQAAQQAAYRTHLGSGP